MTWPVNAAAAIAAIREVQARTPDHDDRSQENDRCDGPDERTWGKRDLDAMADEACDRDERARERGAA